MHRLSASFVLGYHGCRREVADRLLSGEPFQSSANDYDWLGSGIYFWEANPRRALSFAAEGISRSHIGSARPAAVGAVIDLGLCLDLSTEAGIQQVQDAYKVLEGMTFSAAVPMPSNESGTDKVLRRLDCAVVNQIHQIRRELSLPTIDTVRGIFSEGEPAYPGAGFREKTHSQICVCNPNQIRGVFRVPAADLAPFSP